MISVAILVGHIHLPLDTLDTDIDIVAVDMAAARVAIRYFQNLYIFWIRFSVFVFRIFIIVNISDKDCFIIMEICVMQI